MIIENITSHNEKTGSKAELTLESNEMATCILYSVTYINFGAESHETIIRKTEKGARTQYNILKNTYFGEEI